ncbi:amidohydrolase family protein [Mycolicibacterium wolinskyi]|uniref:Amidohydrolase-related domain-containing protein n=1 Tax=Mycolicibacterium wolinskyi TaxID=59750 RepID=A0A1X2F260_9MYCO|nr:amidohydrolase family protein [Mycolicibacterium wolinskyi]ORX12466.1 hypothetical protein AWC31_31300 [Mycolicibacterium wolinskyi]
MNNFVVENVRVFTGAGLSVPTSVAVVDGRIAGMPLPDMASIDGCGAALLPGLIDTHVHVHNRRQLMAYGRWGVTTVLDMGTANWPATDDLRRESMVADLKSAGNVACAVNGRAVRKMHFPSSSAVSGPADAARFVADRAAQGVDYIKIVLEEKLPFQPKPLDTRTVEAVVAEAHKAGFRVCVHAASVKSFKIASDAGADVLTHAPLASALDGSQARDIAQRGHAVSPTLVMMKKLVERFPAPIKPKRITYQNVVQSVQALHRAGATILVGTDANSDPTAPNTIEHGASLHEELELLVQAGLSPVEALNGATQTAADVFGLTDRGRISPGQRADMLLVEGDPTTDILATQNIKQVWIAGEVVR